jgi:intracellular sulfur oxidation DsrE/DsrF family protein
MKQVMGWMLVGVLLLVAVAVYMSQTDAPQVTVVSPEIAADEPATAVETPAPVDGVPDKIVLDVSVHTIEGLRVLFDRAEKLAKTPRPKGENAILVLVLHGPEVEYFSIRNYDRYKDIVDQAARLDAFDVVDVRICQTMIGARGIERTDIPSFIEQVPYGPGEVERLRQEGYVTF